MAPLPLRILPSEQSSLRSKLKLFSKWQQLKKTTHLSVIVGTLILAIHSLSYSVDFQWCVVDLNDQAQLKEVHELLSANYVEDGDATFRFQYTAEFLEW